MRLPIPVSEILCKAVLFLHVCLLISCATLSPNGVGRIKHYALEHGQLPPQFDGYTVAFVSDLHYPSKFTPKRLARLVRALQGIAPDVLLLGGDYVTSNDSVQPLFAAISSVETADGIYAVLGNHERRNSRIVTREMSNSGIVLLADSVASITRGEAAIHLAGIHDSFAYDSLAVQPAETVPDSLFTILLCHTPDYAECPSTTADVVFSGHTHGGQVSLLGLYTPVTNSRYGTRFLRGRNTTSGGATVITTNGVGTSRKKIRFCVPSEIVVVKLKRNTY